MDLKIQVWRVNVRQNAPTISQELKENNVEIRALITLITISNLALQAYFQVNLIYHRVEGVLELML